MCPCIVESSMFTFVYLWTPTLLAGKQTSTPLGKGRRQKRLFANKYTKGGGGVDPNHWR